MVSLKNRVYENNIPHTTFVYIVEDFELQLMWELFKNLQMVEVFGEPVTLYGEGVTY